MTRRNVELFKKWLNEEMARMQKQINATDPDEDYENYSKRVERFVAVRKAAEVFELCDDTDAA